MEMFVDRLKEGSRERRAVRRKLQHEWRQHTSGDSSSDNARETATCEPYDINRCSLQVR